MDEQTLASKTILVVDDETDLRDIVASELEFMGAKTFQAENVAKAQKLILENQIDLVVSDIRMPGGTGIDLLDFIKERNTNNPPIILITGFADITAEDAFNKGAEGLMNKPFKLDDLIKFAVRYTGPVSSRFNESETGTQNLTLNFERSFEEMLKTKDFSVGRGGLSIHIYTHGKKFEIGEIFSFSLTFTDITLTGVGVCRWFKPIDHGTQKASLGLEFIQVEDKALSFLMNYWNSKKMISFIPSLEKN